MTMTRPKNPNPSSGFIAFDSFCSSRLCSEIGSGTNHDRRSAPASNPAFLEGTMNELPDGFLDTYSIGATKELEFGKHQLRFENVKLLEVAAAFHDNMGRACRLTNFLPYLVTLATERERLYCEAHQEICGSVEGNVDELSETTKERMFLVDAPPAPQCARQGTPHTCPSVAGPLLPESLARFRVYRLSKL